MSEQDRLNKPISLEGSDSPIGLEGGASGVSQIRATGAAGRAGGIGLGKGAAAFKRTPNVNGQGAIRCRVFHCRVAPAPLAFMENQINEWIDAENIEIKHVSQLIGTMEGKVAEPNMIVTVWY